jgi:hypothetical protein
MKSKFDGLHDNIMSAENNMSLTPQGSGGYDMHPATLAPQRASLRPQSAAQHASTVKAGRVSAMRRKAAAGTTFTPKMGM